MLDITSFKCELLKLVGPLTVLEVSWLAEGPGTSVTTQGVHNALAQRDGISGSLGKADG